MWKGIQPESFMFKVQIHITKLKGVKWENKQQKWTQEVKNFLWSKINLLGLFRILLSPWKLSSLKFSRNSKTIKMFQSTKNHGKLLNEFYGATCTLKSKHKQRIPPTQRIKHTHAFKKF